MKIRILFPRLCVRARALRLTRPLGGGVASRDVAIARTNHAIPPSYKCAVAVYAARRSTPSVIRIAVTRHENRSALVCPNGVSDSYFGGLEIARIPTAFAASTFTAVVSERDSPSPPWRCSVHLACGQVVRPIRCHVESFICHADLLRCL